MDLNPIESEIASRNDSASASFFNEESAFPQQHSDSRVADTKDTIDPTGLLNKSELLQSESLQRKLTIETNLKRNKLSRMLTIRGRESMNVAMIEHLQSCGIS